MATAFEKWANEEAECTGGMNYVDARKGWRAAREHCLDRAAQVAREHVVASSMDRRIGADIVDAILKLKEGGDAK